MARKRVLVCITGASGVLYGVNLIRQLKKLGHEIHLIVTKWGAKTLEHETGLSVEQLGEDVDRLYDEEDLSAGPASGSFHLDAMVVIPCSMKTLAGIAHGYASNLVIRAADCSLKERRPLVVVPRETPLNLIHIRNMQAISKAGAIVMPASPAFWHKPKTVDEVVSAFVERVLVHLNIHEKPSIEWAGI
ncbi:MAG: UbiX family flavin prenyltransferase [Candidatus Thorarchaeota archaeon]|nr:UbiX family flavin prenyltransferase [Candidatus Thorarchaeota archaeon]